MIDITEKKIVKREAIAQGIIMLKKETVDKINKKQVKKGDVFETARITGINAVKQTQIMMPHCHQIPIEYAEVYVVTLDNMVKVECHVKTTAKTGVEMEALVGATMALNSIWDMVKYLEKDQKGQYPETRISDIKIIKKVKNDE